MNRWQVSKQVKSLLAAAAWPDAGLVFPAGSVFVTDKPKDAAMKDMKLPMALILPGEQTTDPDVDEQPGLVGIDVAVGIVVANEQDQLGEKTLIGSNRSGGSKGRGLLEVEEKAIVTLLQLGPAGGLPIAFRSAGAALAGEHPTLGYVAFCDYRFRAIGTVARTYAPPFGLAASVAGATVNLSWTASPRFDARRFVLRRASGTTPPADQTSGTSVTLGGTPDGSGVTSKADTPGSGTWAYALFLAYDDTGAGSDVAFSSGQSATAVVP